MKIQRVFGRANFFLLCLRVTVAGGLILGGGAMAFVATSPSSQIGKTETAKSKSHSPPARSQIFANRLETLLSVGEGGEAGPKRGAAEEAYADRAYPARAIDAATARAAANAAVTPFTRSQQ